MKLALALGATLGELDARMGAREYAEWITMNGIEPLFVQDRVDVAGGIIGSTIARANGSKSAKVGDFMPRWGMTDEQPDVKKMQAKLLAVFRMAGIKVVDNRRKKKNDGDNHCDTRNQPDGADGQVPEGAEAVVEGSGAVHA